jgi:hypothetical protein
MALFAIEKTPMVHTMRANERLEQGMTAAAMLLAAAVGWFLVYRLLAQDVGQVDTAPAPHSASTQSRAQQQVFAAIAAGATAAPPRRSSKSDQIDRLSRSGKPRDAYAAYQIAIECKETREAQRRGEAIAAHALEDSCGDISQVQIMDIGKNLEKAAAGGVPGALQELLAFGPLDGDASALDTRPTDPLVIEWKHKVQQLFALAARHGDLESMAMLSQAYETGFFDGKDQQLALAYEVAHYDLLVKSTDPRHVGMIRNGVRMADLTAHLDPGQIAAATALGKKLVAECCQQ